jgi:hypothetical protein
MGHSCPDERLSIELSLCEAMTISAALRQYEPYWHITDSPQAVAEQLEHIREDIVAVIRKLSSAAALSG